MDSAPIYIGGTCGTITINNFFCHFYQNFFISEPLDVGSLLIFIDRTYKFHLPQVAPLDFAKHVVSNMFFRKDKGAFFSRL